MLNPSIIFSSETVKLVKEGDYNLNVLKKVIATDSFLGMDQEIIGCQDSEPYYNCTTRQYINKIMGKCGCLPLNMRLSISTQVML